MANVKLNKFVGVKHSHSGNLISKLDITDWVVSEVPEGLRYDKPLVKETDLASWLIVSQTPATDTSPSIQTVQYFKTNTLDKTNLQFVIETETAEFALPKIDDLIGYLLRKEDVVEGTSWHDSIFGGDGDDILRGNDGVDHLDGGAGADTIDGGDGWLDTLSYASSKEAVSVNLAAGTFSGGDAEGDRVFSIERWVLSENNDLAVASDDADTISGGAGNDIIFGNKGNDHLRGGNGDDVLFQEEGAGLLSGDNGNDTLFAGDLGTVMFGGHGNDWLISGAGGDTLRGGEDVDWVSYSHAASGIHTSLSRKVENLILQRGEAKGDSYNSIENIHGSAFDDHLVSSDGEGTIVGWDGNDKLVGSEGSNTLLGDNGNDQLLGGKGDDFLLGGAGNDVVRGDVGNDYVDGGDGNDLLSAASGKNVFFDGAGNDRIFGGVDDDYVVLGGGQDIVYGGNGNDMVRVSTTGNTLWHDFQSGENRLDLTYTTISRSEFESTARDSADGLELDTGDGWITLADTSLETFDFDDDVLYGA